MDFFDFLDKRYYGASVTRWLLALAIAFGSYLVLTLLQRWMKHRVGKFAQRTATTWDDLLVEVISRTHWSFLIAVSLEIAALLIPANRRMDVVLRGALAVVSLLQAGVWGNGIIAFFADRYTRLRTAGDIGARATVYAVGYLARIALWSLVVVSGLGFFDIRITALLTGLGIGGIAVALAAQNVLGDLFAALAIVMDRPFVVGDFVIFDDLKGEVVNIGLKTTRIRSLGGEEIVVANSDLLKSRIRNYRRMRERRVVFTLDVTYSTPPDVMAGIPASIRAIVEAQPKTRFDRCHFLAFAASSLQVETVYYVLDPDYNRYADIQHAINLAILRRFAADKIEFAFPTRTVILQGEDPRSAAERT